jgi:hypothetical protein
MSHAASVAASLQSGFQGQFEQMRPCSLPKVGLLRHGLSHQDQEKSKTGPTVRLKSLGVKNHVQITELLGGNKVAFVQIDLEHWRHEADCHALPAHNWPADTLAPALKH